ncbi:hypothetical protein [Vagococcus carniphilus]|uniref:DUF2187 domain-containing protein n=1 Tax=Vagococcus carniphilus TaxID=218144 RepID=A0AAW8U3W9_9ENTE|nr:hypothetical protein [Vagococcus carniphilus]MDT2813992.1 hypothetical protein [Vagococcus carniphilus]MDT2830446.1 hypothetical protein [Vagococcus carniphilus]MDT2832482.1 hypothetical protein [Vagococcus carniphilus]MDT2839985.1 hypothetical protein [Vagococcus carniphilus]MDT2848024.1 hypothetical protein [Vagococcus carniphilus]
MKKFKTGDIVQLLDPNLPIVGLVMTRDSKKNKYLIKFSAGQQDYYSEEELMLYVHGQK